MKNRELFASRSVWSVIMKMSVPALVTILVMLLYNMADMYFVAWTGDYAQVASVSLVMPVFTILMAVSTMIGNGGCTRIAQAFGSGDREKARGYASVAAWASIAAGVLVAALCFLFQEPFLTVLGANEQMRPHARAYLLILAAGAPLILLNHTLGNTVRGEGAVKEGMMGSLAATVTNIALDPLFIAVLGLGTGGAAAATVLGNGVGVLYYLFYKKKHETLLTFDPVLAVRNARSLGGILALGAPNAISSVLAGFASTFGNRILVSYGTEAVAAMAAAGKTTMIITMVQMGVCMGVQPFLAYCSGAGDTARSKEAVRKLALLTGGLGLGLGAVCFLGREQIIGLFIKDAQVLALGQEMASVLILSAPFMGIFFLGTNYLQASGRALAASVISVLRQGVLLIPFLYLGSALLGLTGITAAYVAADAVSIAVSAVFLLWAMRGERKGKVQPVSSVQA
ncbi:MAG: MATE family efflux transporter [Eubacteriales bacterium]|nr:MATE family efflux transporter [Eubacteriales bacterium]